MGEEAMSGDGTGRPTVVYPIGEIDPKPTEAEWRVYEAVLEAQRAPEGRASTAAAELRDAGTDEQIARMGGGETSLLIRDRIIRGMAATPVPRAAIHAKYRCLVKELAGEAPSAVESMLADAAAMAWLDLMRCRWDVETLGDASFRKADYYDRRADRAHARLVRSLKALAAVRRVDVSSITVNVENVLAARLGPLVATLAEREQAALEAIDPVGPG